VMSVGKVDFKLPGKGNSNFHGARQVHLIIAMTKWIRTRRLASGPYCTPHSSPPPPLSHIVSTRETLIGLALDPSGPLGSSSSQHKRTPELVLQKDHASFRITSPPTHCEHSADVDWLGLGSIGPADESIGAGRKEAVKEATQSHRTLQRYLAHKKQPPPRTLCIFLL